MWWTADPRSRFGKLEPELSAPLLQLRVLGLGLLQDGDVGVGVFPESEEFLIGRFRFRRIARHGIGATDLKMRQRSGHKVSHDAPVIQQLLELGGCRGAVVRQQVRLPAHVRGVQVVDGRSGPAQFVGRGRFQIHNRLR